jgi:hypothetical protein
MESGMMMHAKLLAINIDGDMHELKFKRLPSPGFTPRTIRTFTCSSTTEYLGFGKNRIRGSMVNRKYFLPSDVEDNVRFIISKPDAQSFIWKLREYRKY